MNDLIGQDMGFGKESEMVPASTYSQPFSKNRAYKKMIVGIPSNGRMEEDCAPFSDALALEGGDGLYESPYIPGVAFRKMRATDIARFLREGIYCLGILGDDTAVEADLDGNRIASFKVEPVTLSVIAREESPSPPAEGRIITSYPNATRKLIGSEYKQLAIDGQIAGKVESVVRYGDVPNVWGAVDVVRTGDTLKRFNLTRVDDLLTSRPGIWRSPKLDPRTKNRVEDKIGKICEKIREFII